MSQIEMFEWEMSELIFVGLDDLPQASEIIGPDPSPALVESIRRHGFEGALRLTRMPDGRLEIAGGGRRVKALLILAAEGVSPFADRSFKLPAYVKEWSGLEDNLRGLEDNETARPNYQARFRAVADLHRAGWTESQISKRTGMNIGTVKQTLRLLLLTPALGAAFLDGDIPYTAALKLSGMTAEQQARAEVLLEEKGELLVKDIDALRRVRADASMEEFLQEAMFEGPQQWPLVVDNVSETVTITMPDSSRRTIALARFMSFIEED